MTCLRVQVQERKGDSQPGSQSTMTILEDRGSREPGGRWRGARLCGVSDCQAHLEHVESGAGDLMHAGMETGRGCLQRKTKMQLEETESRDRVAPRQQAVTLILDFLLLLVCSQM